jgi:DNA primase
VLYNLHRAKDGIRRADRSVLVEGYMDAIGVFTAGVREVVATCGTSLTAQQVLALRRHSDKIVVNFDPDVAGANAAERSINLLLQEGMFVRIAELEDGLDPDEYCKERGAGAYRAKVDGAKDYYYWLEDRVLRKYPTSLEGKLEGLRKILIPAINQLPDEVSREARSADAAGHLGLDPAVVRKERKAAIKRHGKAAAPMREPLRADEKILLNLLVSDPESRRELIPELEPLPAVEQFATERIFKALFALHAGGGSVTYEELHARLDENDRELLAFAVLRDETDGSAVSLSLGEECLRSLQRSSVKTQVAALKARVREAERSGNLHEALRLAEELQDLEKAG